MNFKDKLLDLRKKSGLSQEELGYKLDVSRQTISKWEMGKSTPELDKLVTLSEIFNVSLDELVKDIETKNEFVKNNKIIKLNKKVLLIIWVIICILFGYMTYRYLYIRNYTKRYLEFAEKTQDVGGEISVYKYINNEQIYETHYFKGNIQQIKYHKVNKDSGQIYIYKTEYINANEKYVIDEINKTYTYSDKNGDYGANNAFRQMCDKINSNILSIPYAKFYNLRILFNPNYATKVEGSNIKDRIAIQRGRFFTIPDNIYVSSFENGGKNINYIEQHFNKNDRTEYDTESYFYADIGKSLEGYLQVPDLINYTLIEEIEE